MIKGSHHSEKTSRIEIHKILITHKESIIQKYYQRIPIKIIAKDEDISIQTIGNYLRQWGVKKRESIIRESRESNQEDWKKLIKDRLPYKERVSPETLLRMKENTRINKLYIKNYTSQENRFIIEVKKKILEG